MKGLELQLGLAQGGTVKVIKACHIWEAVVIEQGSLRVNSTSSHSALALQTTVPSQPHGAMGMQWAQQRVAIDQATSENMLHSKRAMQGWQGCCG